MNAVQSVMEPAMNDNPYLGWEVSHPDHNGVVPVHALTRSKARYAVWLRVSQYLPMRLVDLVVHRAQQYDNKPIQDTGCRCRLCNPEK